MSSNTKLMAGLMLLTLIASGCTGGSSSSEEESSTQAIAVQEFNAFPSPTPSDQITRFEMRVENLGDAEVQNLSARLYNPPFATGSGQPKTWRNSSGGAVSVDQRTLAFGNMRSGTEQTPAVPKTRTAQFTSPNLNQNRDVSYTYRSTLSYVYQTDAETEVQVIDSNRYRQQGSPSGSATITNSDGPIKLEVRTPTPFVIYDQQDPTKKVCLIARNKGTGTPFDYTSVDYSEEEGFNLSQLQETDNLNSVIIEAQNVGGVTLEAQDNKFNDNDNVLRTDILGGKGIGCFQIDLGQTSGSIQRTLPLEFTAYYGYKQSESTNILVEGTGQEDSDTPGAPGSGDEDESGSVYVYDGPTEQRTAAAGALGLDSDEANDDQTCQYLNDNEDELADVDTNDDGDGDTSPFDAYCEEQ